MRQTWIAGFEICNLDRLRRVAQIGNAQTGRHEGKQAEPCIRRAIDIVEMRCRRARCANDTFGRALHPRPWRAVSKNCRVVALDERGTAITTVALAERLKAWQLSGDDVAIVIGGPDGLDAEFKQSAQERLRLSDLTLPHAMVRVLLIEQLYRAWSITINHPYHRE